MISEEDLMENLLKCDLFYNLPYEIFSKIMGQVVIRSWLTVLNVSRQRTRFKYRTDQKYFSTIGCDGLKIVRRRVDDIFESICSKKVLKPCQNTVVFAHGEKLPGWLYLFKNKNQCLVL